MRVTLAIAAVLTLPVWGQDRIDRLEGPPLAGIEVIKENFNKVTYRRAGGQARDIRSSEVLDITRGDSPPVLREGKAKLLSGDLRNAVGLLTLAAKDAKHPWVKEYASFYLAESKRRLGESRDAVRAYETVLAAKPDTRFLPRVRMGIALAYTADGAYGEAESVLTAFTKEVDAKSLPRYYGLEAKQLLGRNLEAQKKYSDAARQFDGVVREAQSLGGKATDLAEKRAFKLVELRAARDKGGVLIQDKKYGEAGSVFAGLLRDKGEPLATALGLMGQAEVELAQGNADRARVLLSKVLCLQFGIEEEHPRLLRLLGEAYLALKAKNEKDAAKMARIYLEDLINRYPGSEDAKAALALKQRL